MKLGDDMSLENYYNILSIVRSESMIPSLQVGDILISHPMPFVNNIPNSESEKGKLLRIGDIILLQVHHKRIVFSLLKTLIFINIIDKEEYIFFAF